MKSWRSFVLAAPMGVKHCCGAQPGAADRPSAKADTGRPVSDSCVRPRQEGLAAARLGGRDRPAGRAALRGAAVPVRPRPPRFVRCVRGADTGNSTATDVRERG